jgi:5-oxopent-3-ene-1,2,5-tricarboxylate decarboxylase/2-hydroxyhepta-2,4-diene-1,7-dioate isomerase
VSDRNELAGRLRKVPVCSALEILRSLGVTRVLLTGLRPMAGDGPIAGPARTARLLPLREDQPRQPRGPVNRRLVDALEPGDVYVVDAMGCLAGAVFGDMQAARASFRQMEGAVIDGAVRDVEGLAGLGVKVWAKGSHPDPSGLCLTPWEIDVPIQCGGVFVQPGDWMLADADGVLVVPATLLEPLLAKAEVQAVRDDFSQRLMALGYPMAKAYPIAPELEPDLERFRTAGTLPGSYSGS